MKKNLSEDAFGNIKQMEQFWRKAVQVSENVVLINTPKKLPVV